MSNEYFKLEQVDKKSVLYHYTKSNGINGIINNNCFWATKSDFLNDPKEFSHIENSIVAVCKEMIAEKHLRKMFLKDILDDSMLGFGGKNREYFVICFSNCRDSITMWSEFGAKTGYNIGLPGNEIVTRIKENNKIEYHGFVVYDPDKQKNIIRTLFMNAMGTNTEETFVDILKIGYANHEDPRYRNMCKNFQRKTAVYAMFFKNEAFKEEQEYRLIFERKKGMPVHFREKDGFLIPYMEIHLSEKTLPINEIVVAPQNHIDLAQKGLEYMLQVKGYHVPVSLSNIKLRY